MDHENHNHDHAVMSTMTIKPTLADYMPLITVLLFVAGSALLLGVYTGFSVEAIMMNLMGFFFLYFALFKLITLPDFVMGYSEYDLIAQRVKAWAWIYPFIEVCLGVVFIAGWANVPVLWFTVLLTAVNSTGIIIKLSRRELFQCACLGTVLKVPLTIVSLVEYAAMGLMALVMLLFFMSS